MSERGSAKPKRADAPKTARKQSATVKKTIAASVGPAPSAISADVSGVAAASAEIAHLQTELVAARARIAELEQRQTDIANRIDWVIDSLHNLTD